MVSTEELLEMAQAIRDDLEAKLKESEARLILRVTKLFEQRVDKKLSALAERHGQELQLLSDEHKEGFQRLEAVVRAMPIPQVSVSVPDHAIVVQQQPSQVTVPADAIRVQVEQPSFNPLINVPRQESPVINVNVPVQESPVVHVVNNVPEQTSSVVVNLPEQAAPQVVLPPEAIKIEHSLSLPKRKTTTEKSVLFDTGRQAKVYETVTEEDA